MKKVLLFLALLFSAFSMKAEVRVNSYYNSHFDRDFEITVFMDNDTIQQVWIGVVAEDDKRASIIVDGDKLSKFIWVMEWTRDRFLEEVNRAKENNTNECYYYNDYFPTVGVIWIGASLNFGYVYDVKMVMKARTLMERFMMSWEPKLEDISNPYNEEQIYFILEEKDFDYLIDALKHCIAECDTRFDGVTDIHKGY